VRPRPRLRTTAGSLIVLAAFVAGGCGTPSPDLFVVTRDGTVPGAKLTMLVSDQSVRCNNGPEHPLTSAQTLEARELDDDLLKLQSSKAPLPRSAPAQIFSFAIRTEQGTLRYPDTAQRPTLLPRLTRFIRQTAINTCKLVR
jgi:hypothetical protein